MNIVDRMVGRKSSGLLLLLGISLCFGYTVHNQILLRFWSISEWREIGIVLGLTGLFFVVFYRIRGAVLPPDWKQWHWYQQTGLVSVSLLLAFGILQSDLIHLNGLREVTITIFGSQQDKKITTYYCMGLFDRKKRKITSPGEIADKAEVLQGINAVNKGNGLWSHMPSMGNSFQVRWKEKIHGHAFPLSLGFVVHPSAGNVTVGFNNETKTVDLYSAQESTTLIKLPAVKQHYPLNFLCVSIVLAVMFCCILEKLPSISNIQFAKKNPGLFTGTLIALPVICFNMIHVFGPRYLLHDDPHFYRFGINHMVDWYFWNKFGMFSAFTEGCTFWMMAHYSPYVVRLLYVLLYLTGISFCIYWIARRIFNLSPICSYLAAVLPAIYPLQYQIIAGINMSYTLVGTLIALLSMIAGFYYLTCQKHSWTLVVLAGLLYAVSTRLMEQAVLLSAALGFVYLATSHHWKRKFILLLPVAFASGSMLLRMIITPRDTATPINLPWDVILSRSKTFLMYLSPFRQEYGAVLVVTLLAFGGASLLCWKPLHTRLNDLPHFSWLPKKIQVLLLPTFALLWTISSVFPFVTMKQFMPIRTLHIAGYGPWLIMSCGLIFLLSLVLFFLNQRIKKNIIILVVILTVAGAGVQHISYAMNKYKNENYYWTSLSKAISHHAFPYGSQIVITNITTATHHSYPPCSGSLSKMLGNRLDIGGLVGPEFFYYDPFAQFNLWHRPMTGLKSMDNLHLFRWVPRKNPQNQEQHKFLQPYNYFLRVITDESEIKGTEKAGDWSLYKINSNGKAELIHNGRGLLQYKELLAELQKNSITPKQICWGNPENKYGCNSPKKHF